MDIHVLYNQGVSKREISRRLGISRNSVRKYLRNKSLKPVYKPRNKRPAKLDPYRTYIEERIKAASPYWIPATVLFDEIKARGYQGQVGQLRTFVAGFKKVKADPVVRFETNPGEQMQVDFTTIKRGKSTIKAFVATLGYSRASYVRFSTHEKQEDWLIGIKEACQYFGGVPKDILFDNAKCIMIERDAYGDGKHRWNAALLAMAKDYTFRPRACKPYRAKTKGKVERFNGYLKGSFITPLAASLKQSGLALDPIIANAHIGEWLDNKAHQRIHGTTGVKPQERLDKEKHSLQPLPIEHTPLLPSPSKDAVIIPFDSLQHPLEVYDNLLGGEQ